MVGARRGRGGTPCYPHAPSYARICFGKALRTISLDNLFAGPQLQRILLVMGHSANEADAGHREHRGFIEWFRERPQVLKLRRQAREFAPGVLESKCLPIGVFGILPRAFGLGSLTAKGVRLP